MLTSVVLGALHWACCAIFFLSLLFGLSACVVCVAFLGVHVIFEMAGVQSKYCEPAGTLACVLWRLRRRGGHLSCSRWRGGPLSCCFAIVAFSSCCAYSGDIVTACCWRVQWLGWELLSVC